VCPLPQGLLIVWFNTCKRTDIAFRIEHRGCLFKASRGANMYRENLVFGLLDTSEKIDDRSVALKLRSRTISWTRYGYQGLMIEKPSAEEILDEALALDYQYCLIQSYGHIITEDWHPKNSKRANFHGALRNWIATRDFFITGHLLFDDELGYGLSEQCLLVNLDDYRRFGRPHPGKPCNEMRQISKALPCMEGEPDGTGSLSLQPSNETQLCRPGLYGWNLIHASLQNGKAVYSFDEAIRRNTVYLNAGAEISNCPADERLSTHSERESGETVEPGRLNHRHLKQTQERFVHSVRLQIENARRGVFLWNIEPYDDVATPPPNFHSPLSALHCVAAGFKPNMILHTHGFTERTRLVFFDYSPQALAVKKVLHEEWDGEDYTGFVKYILKKFPHPETFYQLWAEASPENLNWQEVDRLWQDELARWGGEKVFKAHWQRYRELKPEFFTCDILTEQPRLVQQIDTRPNSVIWWSNAFFTVYSNWTYSIEERQQIYKQWIKRLAERNPEVFIYGADCNNTSVNFVQAEAYATAYSQFERNDLNPHKQHRHEIRF
jgi:hypothetical protein